MGDRLTIRQATEEDRHAIVELCRASLGWKDGDVDEEFFAWKHDLNPAGRSPAWVAEDPDAGIVGVRVFMRWRYRSQKLQQNIRLRVILLKNILCKS